MFIVIVSAILGTVVAVALVSIKFLFSDHLAKKFYKIFAFADFFIASSTSLNRSTRRVEKYWLTQ